MIEPNTPAFALRVRPFPLVPIVLWQAVAAWARHHYTCSTCGAFDWYAPGRDASMEYDVHLLCHEGRTLFLAWDHLTFDAPLFDKRRNPRHGRHDPYLRP